MKKARLTIVAIVVTLAVHLTASGPLGIYGIVEKVVFEPNFRLPGESDGRVTAEQLQAIKREWADLKAVAGTGQAIGFGRWGYIGAFSALRPDVRTNMPPYILERARGNPQTDLRVRPASEIPGAPALYATETGVVKLSASGSHQAIVRQLRNALER